MHTLTDSTDYGCMNDFRLCTALYVHSMVESRVLRLSLGHAALYLKAVKS